MERRLPRNDKVNFDIDLGGVTYKIYGEEVTVENGQDGRAVYTGFKSEDDYGQTLAYYTVICAPHEDENHCSVYQETISMHAKYDNERHNDRALQSKDAELLPFDQELSVCRTGPCQVHSLRVKQGLLRQPMVLYGPVRWRRYMRGVFFWQDNCYG